MTMLPVPLDGLAAVLSNWTGRGTLFEALSLPFDEREVRQWSVREIRYRAKLVLLLRLEAALLRWPKRVIDWTHHLPAASSNVSVSRSMPFAGVKWAETRRRHGWPPNMFAGREVSRAPDMMMVQVLKWCALQLESALTDIRAHRADFSFKADQQAGAAVSLISEEPLVNAIGATPTKAELSALRREGTPWGAVAAVAEQLLAVDRSTLDFAYELLLPDEEMRWRLFHLAVVGVILSAAKHVGCEVESLRPLDAKSGRPNYRIVNSLGREWRLWFEASGIWEQIDSPSPFVAATRGLKHAPRANGADILIIEDFKQALIVECKYSADHERVARSGYYQAVSYGAEAKSRFASEVVSLVVGPETVVSRASFAELSIGLVGTVPPSVLSKIATKLFSSDLSTSAAALGPAQDAGGFEPTGL